MKSQIQNTLYICYISAVLGALIGKQKGRNIEVMNSFELLFDLVDDQLILDREYYNTKEDQCKAYSHTK